MSIERLGYLGFAVKDVPAWDAFMTKKLGLMPAGKAGDGALYRMDQRAWRIAVHPGELDDLAYIGLEVDNAAALERMADKLREAGVPFTRGDEALLQQRKVMGMLCLQDPFELPIEIYYGPFEVYPDPFLASAPVSGFVTGDQGLGHFVRCVPDAAKALAFYMDVLGFQLSDVVDIQLGPQLSAEGHFLHCNGRHHTIAIGELPLPKRIHHFMLQVNTLDDVGHAYDRFDAEGLISMQFGRHINDHMISFYGRTPAAPIDVEFGYGARTVDASWTVTRHGHISMWGHKPLLLPEQG
ncbi:VOC family protein [Extensimonas vulgaris]|uniref:Biphenyl-2,3-diol 1,2-dioxygenase n=1 Tax=Extensimonas vulgaris TaxID=1031594 RepID=A0A369ARS0_9BURK|nr:VOC family protein [Extensimonas vulgaris]RCX11901.1 biphenyl-2,3-diol 1,2-dioxygenase [Extensimonas vulgaris]TWI39008.1 biphenyl-2,3-diol 1,2-dioxygenase [Extensimonas vulgaris]TXD14901.1 2,3-dihydroxybiphenyl 1,2-dioxygenase [Extensimonas vulgaris]